ncbi:MAG: hypothetical protein CMM42_09565 [Rhodospirillaceae bacterium]|nr:hypothetical protein [Rhodospirillaceae bacterium]
MTHGDFIKCSRSFEVMASARGALCRLSATDPWFWLVRPAFIEASTYSAVVLLHGLPGFLVALGEGGLGNG